MDQQIKKVIVKYHHDIVGYLIELEDEKIAFQYDAQWVQKGFSISPFSLPLSSQVFIAKSPYFKGLFGVFHDSLPDGWGELLIRRFLSKNGINFERLSALTLLTLIRQNGKGGLTYEPFQPLSDQIPSPNLDDLAKDIEKILNEVNPAVDIDRLFVLGGSSGGARPKAYLLIDGDEWIVKFPLAMDPKNIGELEYKANTLAQKAGIQTNEFKLFPSQKSSGYFGTKRFDRLKHQGVHMISLSALLETTHQIPNLDYKHLFQVIQRICLNQNDLYEAYQRMCFNVFFGNKDDHGKNFSFLYDDHQKGYVLSPAYDITHTPDKFEHEMTVLGVGNPTESDLLKIAEDMKLSLSKCKSIIAKIKAVLKDNTNL